MDVELADTSWQNLTQYLGQQLRRGSTNRELKEILGGIEIEWTGTVDELHLGRIVPSVCIVMPCVMLKVDDEPPIQVTDVMVFPREDAVKVWQDVAVSQELKFRASFPTKDALFGGAELLRYDGGREILFRLDNAIPSELEEL